MLSAVLKVIILFGLFWIPISYLLAGNLSFTFSEKEGFQGGQSAMNCFWFFNYGIGVGTMFILLAHVTQSVFLKFKNE